MATKNTFELLLDNASDKTALLAAASSDDTQVEAQGSALSAEQALQVCQRCAMSLRATGVEHLVTCGGLIYLMLKTTEQASRRSFLLSIAEDLGISATKAYDSIAVFRGFGTALLENPELMARFTMEPLKLLSSKQVDVEVREAAVALAASGQRVSTKKATELIAQFAPAAESLSAAATIEADISTACAAATEEGPADDSVKLPAHSSSQPIWQYEGDVVRLIIEADAEEVLPHVSVLHDLEAALDEYRSECLDVDTTSVAAG